MIKIELDNLRILKYQELKNNLEAVKEFFRHGDILLKSVNSTLQATKDLIDNKEETSFTPNDFNEMLTLRNEVLYPIFQNASFAVEFIPYDEGVVIPDPIIVPDPILEPITTTENLIVEGILKRSSVKITLGDKIIKTIDLVYNNNILTEKNSIEYLEDSKQYIITKYDTDKIIYEVKSIVTGNIVETTITNLTDGTPISYNYTKFVEGVLIENITTLV
jgi:hypothetical protein